MSKFTRTTRRRACLMVIFSTNTHCESTALRSVQFEVSAKVITKVNWFVAVQPSVSPNICPLTVTRIVINFFVCPGDTSVHIHQKLNAFRHETENFFRQDHLREHVQLHQLLGKPKGASKMSSTRERNTSSCCKMCFRGPDQKRPGNVRKNDHRTNLLTEGGTLSRFG